MSQVVQFPQKGKLPSQEAEFEKRLNMRTESRDAVPTGEIEHVADTSTGEQVEVDPVRFNSVYSIYKVIEQNFAKKDEAGRQAALGELQKSLGVTVSSELSPSTVSEEVTDTADQDSQLKKLMHALAEDIYDALENCRESIAAIKPETISGRTTSRLREKGDANFIVAPGQGEALYESLQKQDADFRLVRKNEFGFVVENVELGFKVMFIYQERLNADGSPKKLEEAKPDEAMVDASQDDTAQLAAQQSNNQSHLGQGGSLAA